MDVNMPTCDGIVATQRIRRFATKVKILFYSGYPQVAKKALAAGGNGFLTKGAPTSVLPVVIAALLVGGVYVDASIWGALGDNASDDTQAIDRLSEEEQKINLN